MTVRIEKALPDAPYYKVTMDKIGMPETISLISREELAELKDAIEGFLNEERADKGGAYGYNPKTKRMERL